MEDFKIPLSVATASIGFRTNKSLADKLEAIARAGYDGIELAFPDLVAFASEHAGHTVDASIASGRELLLSSARQAKALCRRLRLQVVMLQPFTNFEGWPENSKERKDAFDRARLWIDVMKEVGADMLQVGSKQNIDPHLTLFIRSAPPIHRTSAPTSSGLPRISDS
jgi:sugar phosphate isomerase/epimerase